MDQRKEAASKRLAGARCLVTGGTGVLGRLLVEGLIQEGGKVTVLARPSSDTSHAKAAGAKILIGDILEPQSFLEATKHAEIIFHLAEPGLSERRFLDCFKTSIQTLIHGARGNRALRRIIYISTAYTGSIPSRFPADEDTPVERLLMDLHTAGNRRAEKDLMESGLPCTILRCPMIYGPGVSHFVKLLRIMRRLGPMGLPFPGDLNAIWSYLHIDDFIEACICSASTAEPESRTFILCDDSHLSIHDFFASLSERLGMPIRFRQPPLWALGLAARLFSMAPQLTMASSIGEWMSFTMNHSWFTNKRLKDALGMEFAYPTVHQGLDGFADYLKRQILQ